MRFKILDEYPYTKVTLSAYWLDNAPQLTGPTITFSLLIINSTPIAPLEQTPVDSKLRDLRPLFNPNTTWPQKWTENTNPARKLHNIPPFLTDILDRDHLILNHIHDLTLIP